MPELTDGRLIFTLERSGWEKGRDGTEYEGLHFLISLKDTGTKIGRLDFRDGDTGSDIAEWGHISYFIIPQERGKGWMTSALRILLPFLKERGRSFAEICVRDTNIASRRVCEKAGAEHIKTEFDRDGEKILRYRLTF